MMGAKSLKNVTYLMVGLLIAIQLILLWQAVGFAPTDDQITYLNNATRSIKAGKWYPSELNLTDGFLFAPGYVNLLILYHHICGSFAGFGYVNLAMSLVILYYIYALAKRFLCEQAACVSVIIYVCTYSSWYLPIGYFSEVPFVFFMMCALATAILTKTKWINYLLVGIFLGVGNWIRPLAIAYLIGILLYIIVNREYVYIRVSALLISTVLTVLSIGYATKTHSGVFVFQSTTSGVNLAGSANKYANGLVGFRFIDDEFYQERLPKNIKLLSFKQKDSEMRKIAKEWIFENPVKYISQIPLKSAVLLGFDTWSERYERGSGLSSDKEMILKDRLYGVMYIIKLFFKSIVYYATLLMFAMYLWRERCKILNRRNIIAIIPFIVICMTLPFMVTDRYHYPIMPIVMIYAGGMIFLNTDRTKRKDLAGTKR